jgi:hypothetical protein
LFVCKLDTYKLLTKKAAKVNGLVGATFDVMRNGDKSASVGNSFDFVEKNSLADISTKFGLKPEDVLPLDYSTVIRRYGRDELRKLGFGGSVVGSIDKVAVQKVNYEVEM